MANSHRGEVDLKAGDETYTLVFTINTLCDMEEERPGVNILGDLSKLSNIRYLLLSGLRERHPKLNKVDAGRILQDAGLPAAQSAIQLALERGIGPKDKTENP
jgi:hypothetical protein